MIEEAGGGHLDTAAGLGSWPKGRALLEGLIEELCGAGEPERAEAADRASVLRLYRAVGYEGGLHEHDRVFVVRDAGDVVAAVRLCEEQGVLVLRGMYVAEAQRGKGIGKRLLARVAREIGPVECWCVPYRDLVEFYGREGFREAERSSVPRFLEARRRRYERNGAPVTVMCRPPAADPSLSPRSD